jgi:hypothetical protein
VARRLIAFGDERRWRGQLFGGYEQLSSVGWGINALIGKRVSGRLTFAYALNDLPDEPRRYRCTCRSW